MTKDFEIQIEIENRCWLDCLHCSSLLMRNSSQEGFSNEEISAFLRLFDSPVHLYFSGGEPLMNPNLLSFVCLVKNININNQIGIFTCGMLEGNNPIEHDLAYNLRKSGLDDCYVSLYHCNPETHDKITNHPGSFNILRHSIQSLIKNGIEVKSHLVVNRLNYKDLEEIIYNIFNMGVKEVRILRIVKTGSAVKNWRQIGVSYSEQNLVIRRIIERLDSFPGRITISGFPTEIACRPSSTAVKCQAGTNLLYVTSEKRIYPCACTKNNDAFYIADISDISKIRSYLSDNQFSICNDACLNPIRE